MLINCYTFFGFQRSRVISQCSRIAADGIIFLLETMTYSKNPLGQSINPWENPLILMDPSFLGPFFIEFLHVWCSPKVEIPKPLGAIQVAWAKKVLGLNFRARDLKTAGGDGQGPGENRRNPRGNKWECTHVQTLRNDFFLVKSWGYPKSSEWWPWLGILGFFKPMVTGGTPISGNIRISDVIWYFKWYTNNNQQPRGEYESRVDISYGSHGPILDELLIHMVIFYSYVELPEGEKRKQQRKRRLSYHWIMVGQPPSTKNTFFLIIFDRFDHGTSRLESGVSCWSWADFKHVVTFVRGSWWRNTWYLNKKIG